MSHRDAFRPRFVTKLHLPPCCSLCTPSIHSSSMPISASCGLLPYNLKTTHLSIIILLLRVEALLFLFCFLIPFHLYFKYTYPPSLSNHPFSLFSHSFILTFSPFSLLSLLPPNPHFSASLQ